MRIPRLAFCLLALAVVHFVGCSQTRLLRSNDPSNIKTVASVGDKPLPIVAGEPGTTTTAETEEIDLSPPTGGRISGHVFDDRGKPVPNARVRLVIGGMAGGRNNYVMTDRTGAFTMRGLRGGRSYTLIAESQGEDGVMSGRAEARVAQTDVRINLAMPRTGGSEPPAKPIRPVRSRNEPAAESDSRDEDDFPSTTIRPGSVLPDEEGDPERPADEVDSSSSMSSRQPSTRLASATSPAPVRGGWNTNARPGSPSVRQTARPRHDNAGGEATAGEFVDREDHNDDDGDNPLPPAIDPGRSAPRRSSDRAPARPLDMVGEDLYENSAPSPSKARRSPSTDLASENGDEGGFESPRGRDTGEPRPIPDEVLEAGQGVARASYGSTDSTESDRDVGRPARASRAPRGRRTAPARAPSSRQVRGSDESKDRRQSSESSEVDEPASTSPIPRRPTWRELSLGPGAVPLDESVRRTSVAGPARDREAIHLADNRETAAAATKADPGRRHRPSSPPVTAETSATGESTCQIDVAERRLLDFQLPDLAGKMVAFHDIDADVILLDFWGSWCLQCRKSIGYERDLQARLGGKRVRVIGIACEKGETLSDRRLTAAKAARQLGINYPVLVSSMDGKCPLQKAFQVQFYPTMVVLDHSGRILHVEQGATDATLGRTERTIASALEAADRRVE